MFEAMTLLDVITYVILAIAVFLVVYCSVSSLRRRRYDDKITIPKPPRGWSKPFYENGAHYR